MKTLSKIFKNLASRLKLFGFARMFGGVASVVLVAVAGWWLVQVPPPPPEASLAFATPSSLVVVSSSLPVELSQFLTVHVAGAVKSPGVFRLRQGARVNDGVIAAGGALSSADLDAINLATLLREGEQVYIPKRGEKPRTVSSRPQVGGQSGLTGSDATNDDAVAPAQININLASASELEILPGVGPATAKAIIAYREKNGAFNSVEDLLNVRGIGPAKLGEILPRARVR